MIDAGHKRSLFIKDTTKTKTEEAFYKKFPDKVILWENAFYVKNNVKVEVFCKTDGTSDFRSLNDLKRLKYQCSECMLNNLRSMLNCFNYKLIKFDIEDLKIQCEKCGTCYSVSRSYPYSLAKHGHYCEGCVHSNCELALTNIGFSYLFKVSPLLEKIKCNTCNTLKVVRRKDLFAGEVECKVCRENLYKNNLMLFGCRYVKREDGVVTFINPSGEIRTTTSGQVYRGQFPVNETDYWNTPCQLYIIQVFSGSESYLKIGISRNSSNRARRFKFKHDYEIVRTLTFANSKEAISFEHSLHDRFNFARISEDVVNSFVLSVRKNGKPDGYTEWFSGSILPEVLSILEKQNGIN